MDTTETPATRVRRPLAARHAPMLLVTALTAAVVPLAAGLGAQRAEAATFRYWGYYQGGDGAWTFSSTGADQTKPADGAVEGWRYAVSGAEGSPRPPRATPDFAAVCGETAAPTGRKRVAVVLDYGVAGEAPDGERAPGPRGACAVVEEDASGADALAAVAPVRTEGGLVCSVDGYPATECGAEVDLPVPTASEAPVDLALPDRSGAAADGDAAGEGADDGGGLAGPLGVAVALAAVAAVGVAAVLRARRNRG